MMEKNKKILKSLKSGSGNHNVLSYLFENSEPISVAEAREIGLTNDLRSRISDLKNRYGVEGLRSLEIEGKKTGAKYRVHWLECDDGGGVPLRQRVKVWNGANWLFGRFDKNESVVYYDDGRSQSVASYARFVESGVIVEIEG